MKPLIVKYQRSPIGQTAQPSKTLVIGRLSAELFPEWERLINDGHVDTVIIPTGACTGWRIWVNREVQFQPSIPEDRYEAMCQEQASYRIVKKGCALYPLTSPYSLIQEFLTRDVYYPWRVIVACTLLNKAHGRTVRPVTAALFNQYPSPFNMVEGDYEALETTLRPLGLQKMRAKRLREMTREYLHGFPLNELTGVGPYAMDSLDLFCWGRTDVNPTDQWLKPYLEWRRQGGPAIQWPKDEYTIWWRGLQ